MATIKKPVKKYAMGGPMTTTSETTKKPKYVPTAKEKKNLEDASHNRNMRPPFTNEERKKMKNYSNMGSAKSGTTMKKAQSGLGMKSVKSGYDNNSGVTRADFVAIGKGKAQNGKKLIKSGVKGMSENEKVKKGITKLVPSSSQIKANVMPPKKKMGGSMNKCRYGCK